MKYRYRSTGNMTLVLAGSRKEVVRNSLGDPVTTKMIQPIKIVFDGGFGQTDSDVADELIKMDPRWGRTIYYDPTCVPSDANEDEKNLAKNLAKTTVDRGKEKIERVKRAAERGGRKYSDDE